MYINTASLLKVKPLTPNQEKLYEFYGEGKNIFASGVAGSGKTFLLLYLALKEVLDKSSKYEKVTTTVGFLISKILKLRQHSH